MFGRILPREGKFFELFEQSADLAVESAVEFKKMLMDLAHAESHSRTVKDIEHRADEVTHRTIELLHKTFITPLDREDIYKLITEMDDVVDFIEAAALRIAIYGITQVPDATRELADVCIQSVEHLRKALKGLENLKNPDDIIKNCVEVNRLENEADHLLRAAIAKLFKDEPDTRNLIKLKEVLELLETVTDRCEDVANTIEGIVLEYA